jgi:hypothetical protein
MKKYSQFLMSHQVKKTELALLVCLVLDFALTTAMDNNGRGTKAIALANAFVAVADNPWAISCNPAGLTQLSEIQGAMFFVPEQFGLPELQTKALVLAAPLSFTTIGLKAEQFGFTLYKETEIGIALSRVLDRSVSAGVSINYYHLVIDRYGSTNKLIINIGFLAHVSEQVSLGFNFNNVGRASIGKIGERIPQALTSGMSWRPLNGFLLTVEIEKDVRYPASIKVGVEQTIVDIISLRAGVANNPDKFSVGFAVRYSMVEFSYACYSHNDLDWTHQIELSFTLSE